MKLGKRKWVKGGSPERGGFDEKLLSLGGPGGGARRSIKKPKVAKKIAKKHNKKGLLGSRGLY